MHDRDDVADLLDETHIVLDHDQGVLALEAVEDFRGLAGLLRRHAGGRLVHQDQVRILRHEHADLEPLRLAVRQIGGRLVDSLAQADEIPRISSPAVSGPRLPQHQVAPHALLRGCATSRFSRTLSSLKTLGTWNLRPTPSRAISCSSRSPRDGRRRA